MTEIQIGGMPLFFATANCVGRNVLFCGEDDPAAIAEAINLVVHERAGSIEAINKARKLRGTMKTLGE